MFVMLRRLTPMLITRRSICTSYSVFFSTASSRGAQKTLPLHSLVLDFSVHFKQNLFYHNIAYIFIYTQVVCKWHELTRQCINQMSIQFSANISKETILSFY